MKEELQKEGLSFIKEEIAEIKSNLKERIKLPILVAYCIILVIYNWDVLFYFVLESEIPSQKIAYINKNFTNDYHHRFLIPLLLSFLSTFAFPVLQVGINLLFKEFKNENDQLIKEKEKADVEHEKALIDIKSNNKTIKVLQDSLDNKDDEILKLQSQYTVLEKKYSDLEESEREVNNRLRGETSYANSLMDDINALKEIIKSYSSNDYTPNNLNYVKHFLSLNNFYNSTNLKEKEFIYKMFEMFDEKINDVLKYSKISKIDVFDLVDAEKIFDKLTSLQLIKEENSEEFELTNKGKEVVSLFKLVNNM